jgi:hypothetical protein
MLATDLPAGLADALFRDDAAAIEFRLQVQDRAEGEVAVEDMPDRLGLRFVDHKLPVDGVVAERHRSAHPHALLLRGCDLVADPIGGDLALELGVIRPDGIRSDALSPCLHAISESPNEPVWLEIALKFRLPRDTETGSRLSDSINLKESKDRNTNGGR